MTKRWSFRVCFRRCGLSHSGCGYSALLVPRAGRVSRSTSFGHALWDQIPQVMGPQPGPQTPRNWPNLKIPRENKRPPNTLTRQKLDNLTSTLRICCYRTLNQWVRHGLSVSDHEDAAFSGHRPVGVLSRPPITRPHDVGWTGRT